MTESIKVISFWCIFINFVSMYNPFPEDTESKEYELRNHIGDPKNKILTPEDDEVLPESSIIYIGKQTQPLMLIWITMYS